MWLNKKVSWGEKNYSKKGNKLCLRIHKKTIFLMLEMACTNLGLNVEIACIFRTSLTHYWAVLWTAMSKLKKPPVTDQNTEGDLPQVL